MHRKRGTRLALLLVTLTLFAVTAPVALSANKPSHPKAASTACSTVSGTFGHWLQNGNGQLFAFVLKNGLQVRIHPSAAATLKNLVKPGDSISVNGCTDAGQFKARTITAAGRTING